MHNKLVVSDLLPAHIGLRVNRRAPRNDSAASEMSKSDTRWCNQCVTAVMDAGKSLIWLLSYDIPLFVLIE